MLVKNRTFKKVNHVMHKIRFCRCCCLFLYKEFSQLNQFVIGFIENFHQIRIGFKGVVTHFNRHLGQSLLFRSFLQKFHCAGSNAEFDWDLDSLIEVYPMEGPDLTPA